MNELVHHYRILYGVLNMWGKRCSLYGIVPTVPRLRLHAVMGMLSETLHTHFGQGGYELELDAHHLFGHLGTQRRSFFGVPC